MEISGLELYTQSGVINENVFVTFLTFSFTRGATLLCVSSGLGSESWGWSAGSGGGSVGSYGPVWRQDLCNYREQLSEGDGWISFTAAAAEWRNVKLQQPGVASVSLQADKSSCFMHLIRHSVKSHAAYFHFIVTSRGVMWQLWLCSCNSWIFYILLLGLDATLKLSSYYIKSFLLTIIVGLITTEHLNRIFIIIFSIYRTRFVGFGFYFSL